MSLVALKRCIQVESKTELGLSVAFLVYEKMTKMVAKLGLKQNTSLLSKKVSSFSCLITKFLFTASFVIAIFACAPCTSKQYLNFTRNESDF